ncbi:MAG: hypothetical protein ACRC7S_18320 [Cetobacterium sp.]
MNEIKDRLRNYKYLKARKAELEFRLEELSYSIGPGGLDYEDKGGATNKVCSLVEAKAIELAEATTKLQKLINEHGLEIRRVENALNMLTEKERQAITMKYIENYSLLTIMYKMDRQERAVLYYIGNGLKKINKILNS